MKEPKSKLPWKVELCHTGESCWCRVIGDADNSDSGVSSSGSIEKQDSEYIVQACNNFPKAIELLKEYQSIKILGDLLKFDKKVEEFLKEIDNG